MTALSVRIIKHEAIPGCGSFEVRTPAGSTYFYFEDIASRRLRPEQVDRETAMKAAQEFARSQDVAPDK